MKRSVNSLGEILHHRSSAHSLRRSKSRISALVMLILLTVLGSIFAAAPAHAASGPVTGGPNTRCYAASNGTAYVAVSSPVVQSTQPTQPTYVGGHGQRVGYQPYLQQWDGSSWATILVGPYVTGSADQTFTTWDGGANGYWGLNVHRSGHYRITAQIWWFADATHNAAYTYMQASHQQWLPAYQGWADVNNCRY